MILDVYASVRKDPQFVAPHPFGEVMSKELLGDIEIGLKSTVRHMLRNANYLVTLAPSFEFWVAYLATATGADQYRLWSHPKNLEGEVCIPVRHHDAQRYEHDFYLRPETFLKSAPNNRVILADDVLRSGRTMSSIVDAFTQYNIPVIGVITVLAQGNGHETLSKNYAHLVPKVGRSRLQRPFVSFVRHVDSILKKHDDAEAARRAEAADQATLDAFGPGPDPSEEKTGKIPLPGRSHIPNIG